MPIRIIPCLDIQNGRAVKGVQFKDIKDVGDAIELAKIYNRDGASELMLLNIGPYDWGKDSFLEIVRSISQNITIPLITGGGINSLDDIKTMKDAGAQKVTIGTGAIKDSELVRQSANAFGSSSIIVSIDAKKVQKGKWSVFIRGGRENTGIDVLRWAARVFDLGAGEILLNSMDMDGARGGYDIELIRAVTERVEIPVIASGGAGLPEHFLDAIQIGGADAVLAASLFHYRDIKVQDLRAYLTREGLEIK